MIIWYMEAYGDIEVTLVNRHRYGLLGKIIAYFVEHRELLDSKYPATKIAAKLALKYNESYRTVLQYVYKCRAMDRNHELGSTDEMVRRVYEKRDGSRTCVPPITTKNGTIEDLAILN